VTISAALPLEAARPVYRSWLESEDKDQSPVIQEFLLDILLRFETWATKKWLGRRSRPNFGTFYPCEKLRRWPKCPNNFFQVQLASSPPNFWYSSRLGEAQLRGLGDWRPVGEFGDGLCRLW